MKQKTIFLLVLVIFFTACKVNKQLPLEGGGTLDISGRWNSTDASIIAHEIAKKLATSVWYSSLENNVQVPIILHAINYQDLEEPFDRSLAKLLKKEFDLLEKVNVLLKVGGNTPNYFMQIKLTSETIESFGEQALQYNLSAQLLDNQANLLVEIEESTKKYLSN